MRFFNLTNLFFSTLPNNYAATLQEELYGCFKYIGIPYETLWKMPIQDRKFIIARHNSEQDSIEKANKDKGSGGFSINDGDTINKFAKEKQEKDGLKQF